MGREWYQWGAKSSSKSKVRGGERSSTCAKQHRPPPPPPPTMAAAAASTGCIDAVFQLFDFHHLQFCLHHNHHDHHQFDLSHDDPSSLKGVEAPRNSLETEVVAVDTTASLSSISEMGIQINTSRRDTRLLRSQSPSARKGDANYFPLSEQENSTTPSNKTRRDAKLLRVRVPRAKTGDEQKNSPFSSESSCSPAGPRTPNLVARLMGLDLLPEGYPSSSSCTPRSSNATPHQSHRSLQHPVTPGGSRKHAPRINDSLGSLPDSGRRSDVDGYGYYNRRLSLQINKKDCGSKEELIELSRHSCSQINTKRRDLSWNGVEDECVTTSRSPSSYARQIMKQVKESVMRRRFGVDITNRAGEGQSREQRRDANLLSSSTNGRRSQTNVALEGPELSCPLNGGLSGSSRSPRLGFPEPTMAHQLTPLSPVHEPEEPEKAPMRENSASKEPTQPEQDCRQSNSVSSKKTNGGGSYAVGSRFGSRSSKSKKEEQFVRAPVATTRAGQGSEKKCKKTPLSNELLHGTVVPSLAPLKKSVPSMAATASRKVVQEQVSSGTLKKKTESAKPLPPAPAPAPAPPKSTATSAAATAELHYITQILKRAGINKDTPVSAFTRWFSPPHPLDPSLFHRLEAENHSAAAGAGVYELSPPCNRRLMFDLVDEILAHIIGPPKAGRARFGSQRWASVHGFQVMRMVWTRVKGFPRADCRILEDIDELVEMELSGQGPGLDTGFVAREEEEDDVVGEIEREIVEGLVLDTTVAVGGGENFYFDTHKPYYYV